MGRDQRRAAALLPLAVVVVVAAVLVATSPGSKPDLRTPVGRAVPVGSIAPDASAGGSPSEGPQSPAGQACLDRIQRGDIYLDLCWAVSRDPNDADPKKDFYLLRLYGTYGGGPASLFVKSDLVGSPGDGVMSVWPTGTIEGPCEQRQVHLGSYGGPMPHGDVCGRTVGELDGATWSHTLTWTCEVCQPRDMADRAFSAFVWVGVPAGTIPAWDLFAEPT